tara:strand:+ start:48810 stop:49835 length:1026 start_codon:yes stop_codon:yes gene_type:complete
MSINRENIRSVLVYVGLDRLGDGLLKLPFARGLRIAFPNAHLTWFAGKETSVYAGVLTPLVADALDDVIEYGGVGLHPSELIKPRPLKGCRFDLVIDTQRIFWTSLSAWRIRHDQFISPAAKFLLSSVKPKIGYKSPKAMQRQMLDLLEIASGMTFETPTKLNLDIPQPHHDMAADLLPAGPRYIGFAPGSGGRPKCWPLDRYIALAEMAEASGAVPVFLIGPQEEEWATQIKTALPNALLPLQHGNRARAHGYNPLFTIALGTRLSGAVSNDSGIAHMLAVAGTPLIALYGPTVYEKFPPMTDAITVIRAETYGSREMTAIPLDDVNQALQTLLASAPAS